MAKKKNKNKKETTEDKLVNLQAAQLASQVANYAAQLEFSKERFRLLEMPEWQTRTQLERDKFAWEKAEAEYENALQEATLTGTYRGQPTMQWMEQQAKLTGVINGQQTLEGRLTDAQIAQMSATVMNMQRGMDLEYQKFGVDTQYREKDYQLKYEQQQASLTGYINGLPTFEREQWQANQGQAYLGLLGQLRGPESAFAQLRVLRNTPQALTQMAQSWAGQFSQTGMVGGPPASAVNAGVAGVMKDPFAATANQQGVMQTANGMVQGQRQAPAGFQGQPGAYQPPAYQPQPMPEMVGAMGAPAQQPAPQMGVMGGPAGYTGQRPYTVDPPGSPPPPHAYNYQQTVTGGTQVYPPGVQAPPGQFQVSTYQPMGQQAQQQALAEAQGLTENPYAALAAMPDPSKINAREWNKSTTYEKEVGLAGYEESGWDKGVVKELFQRSLPTYGVKAGTAGSVKV